MTLVYQDRMLFGTGEWSTPSVDQRPLAYSDAPITWPHESTSPHVTLGNLNVELSAVSFARRWAEIFTPRSVPVVCSTAPEVPNDVVSSAWERLRARAEELLGRNTSVNRVERPGEIVLRVEYDAPDEVEESTLAAVSLLRHEFVQMIPEPHWGLVSIQIRPR